MLTKPGGATVPGQGQRLLRFAFLSVWVAVAVVVLAALLYFPAIPQAGGRSSVPSYVGSAVPVGTNFSFLFTEAVAIFAENASVATGPPVTLYVLVSGNWTATNPTWVRVNLGGPGSPTCNGLFGCEGGPANLSGSIHLATEVAAGDSAEGLDQVLYLEFWARGGDTVTAASPISASVVS